MGLSIPQEILDALTDVAMPRLKPEPEPSQHITIGDIGLPVYRSQAVVVGSGAAGLRAAVELHRRNVDVCVISQSAYGGTSACSGSDKQTLHTANSADRGDDFRAMAQAIRAGGAMDEDTSYVEAVGSARAMTSLQYLGLPLPQNALGAALRYQTDHDEVGRATSCGPRTSRLMVQVLAEEMLRLGIALYNHTTAIKLIVDRSATPRIQGVLAVRPKIAHENNPLGLALFECANLVLAAGGPGELYRESVYPRHCFGSLGLALEAGLDLVNLTESQFGIGTTRDGFPWNLSGTYVQAIPYIYSVDPNGTEYNFLSDYYRTTQDLVSNVFRKGYQWPFHATRMLYFKSSLVDIAILKEYSNGRKVFMDFKRNPSPVAGDLPFDLTRLDDDVAAYLRNAGALLETPLERLAQMNPLAIELYKRYKIDITKEPLEFTINNQHMNGGIAVDIWGRTNIAGAYAIGEAAGTHGVTRPGGAALNAGQVFGTRCAEHIAATSQPATEVAISELGSSLRSIFALISPHFELDLDAIRTEVRARMSDHAGVICRPADVRAALAEAQALNAKIRSKGIRATRPKEVLRALQWQQMALASEAVLTALHAYIERGGGSRGARAICDSSGTEVPQTRLGPLEELRFIPENPAHRQEQIILSMQGTEMMTRIKIIRPFDGNATSYFERDWPAFLTKAIYK